MTRFNRFSIWMAVIVWAFCATTVMAQSDKGTIAGTVKDATGAALPGARVEIVQGGPAAVSDAVGHYTISNLPPAEYTITATYVGFSAFTGEVKVKAGEVTNVDAILKVTSQNEVVTVSGERSRGEVEAINIQRTADNIVQVLPAKVITSLPNTNVADAVGRLPSVSLERDEGEGKYVQIRGTEPRLSNTTVDGVNLPSPEGAVRNIKLDVIPSSIVDRIEVNKTLSANQDGDAIGGSVNLVTKTPGEKFSYDFGGQGGYTNILGGRYLDNFDATVGNRYGVRKQFGFLFSSTYDFNGRGINDLEPSPTVVTDSAGKNYAVTTSEDLRTYRYNRTRYGFAPVLDYSFKPGASVYFRGLYSDFHDYGDTWVYSPGAGSFVSQSGTTTVFDNTGSVNYRHYIRRPDQQIFSGLTGGRYDVSSSALTYEFALSRAHNIGGQDFATTRFNNGPQNVQFNVDTSNPLQPKFPVQNGVDIFDPTLYAVSQTILPQYHSTQLNLQSAVSYERRYSSNKHYGSFQTGFKVRSAHKTQSENDQIYVASGAPPILLSDVLGSFTNSSYYDGAYKVGPLSDYGKIRQAISANLGTGLILDPTAGAIQSLPSDFDATERVYAGYLMNTIGFGKLSLQTGLRFEATDATYSANVLTKTTQTHPDGSPIYIVNSVPGASNYISVLPSIQLQYKLPKDTNLRGTFGIGISRPNFADIVPAQITDANTSPLPSIQVGNPALLPTKGYNFDLLIEHYIAPIGILQGGVFYKRLSDPIYSTTSILTGGPFPKYFETKSINGPSGYIAGFEAAWEERLAFLPGALNGLGVAANYSYTTSSVTFPVGFNGGRTDHARLQRQAPNNWNFGVTYDKSRLSVRFAVSHNDASIYSYFYNQTSDPKDPIIGLKGPNGDQYLYAHTQYDIQGSYRIAKGLRAVVSGLNLSNEAFGFYQGSTIYPIQREFYKPSFSFGLRWTSSRE